MSTWRGGAPIGPPRSIAPPPPATRLPGRVSSTPKFKSAFVNKYDSVLARAVEEGSGVHVPAALDGRQLTRERLAEGLQARALERASNVAFGIFDHVQEQEALFDMVARRSDTSTGPTATDAEKAQSMWHSVTGAKKGLLVDTGAVKLLTGGAFVRSQIADMEAKGFTAIWTALAQPEYMRGVGRGS